MTLAALHLYPVPMNDASLFVWDGSIRSPEIAEQTVQLYRRGEGRRRRRVTH